MLVKSKSSNLFILTYFFKPFDNNIVMFSNKISFYSYLFIFLWPYISNISHILIFIIFSFLAIYPIVILQPSIILLSLSLKFLSMCIIYRCRSKLMIFRIMSFNFWCMYFSLIHKLFLINILNKCTIKLWFSIWYIINFIIFLLASFWWSCKTICRF